METVEEIHIAQFHHFLRAKRGVDDRALHQGVYAALCRHLAAWKGKHPGDDPLRVLEVGCGIGTMVERLSRWGLWSEVDAPIHYTALDREAQNLQAFHPLHSPAGGAMLKVSPLCADYFTFAQEAVAKGERWDLLIAHAVLDLLDLERALPLLRGLLHEDGAAWLTINFDGNTILLPTIDSTFDDRIETRYHRTMDERQTDGAPSGDSRTGRKLFTALPAAGLSIVEVGASDWIVTPSAEGGYPQDEATFLHAIVATIDGALTNDPAIDPQSLADWIATRHTQIDAGKLTYLAKQYDFLVKRNSL